MSWLLTIHFNVTMIGGVLRRSRGLRLALTVVLCCWVVFGADGDEEIVTEGDTITVPEHKRKKRGRKALPKELPRVQVIHELPQDQLICDHDGQALAPIGVETSEQLDIIPAKIQVIQHV